MHWLYFLNFLIIWSYYNSKVLGIRPEIAHSTITTSQPQVRLTPIYDNTTIYCTNLELIYYCCILPYFYHTEHFSEDPVK